MGWFRRHDMAFPQADEVYHSNTTPEREIRLKNRLRAAYPDGHDSSAFVSIFEEADPAFSGQNDDKTAKQSSRCGIDGVCGA